MSSTAPFTLLSPSVKKLSLMYYRSSWITTCAIPVLSTRKSSHHSQQSELWMLPGFFLSPSQLQNKGETCHQKSCTEKNKSGITKILLVSESRRSKKSQMPSLISEHFTVTELSTLSWLKSRETAFLELWCTPAEGKGDESYLGRSLHCLRYTVYFPV